MELDIIIIIIIINNNNNNNNNNNALIVKFPFTSLQETYIYIFLAI